MRLAAELEARERETPEEHRGATARTDLELPRLGVRDARRRAERRVVVEVVEAGERSSLRRGQRRLRMPREELVARGAPEPPGGGGVALVAHRGVDGEDATLPVEQVEDRSGLAHSAAGVSRIRVRARARR